jgi:RNA polymerase-binding transcription factor DksA
MDALINEARRRMLERRARITRTVRAEEAEQLAATAALERGDGPGVSMASDVAEQLSAHELHEVREIDAALARIERGSYGRCETCGRAVGRQRLRAVPETRFCVSCAATR